MSSSDVMSESPAADGGANQGRRYFLIGATAAVAGVGAVGAAVPFLRYWNPSAKAKALGAPVKVDISKLNVGEMLTPIPAWRGKPIFILYRDADTIQSLNGSTQSLADPNSDNAEMTAGVRQEPDALDATGNWCLRWHLYAPRVLSEAG